HRLRGGPIGVRRRLRLVQEAARLAPRGHPSLAPGGPGRKEGARRRNPGRGDPLTGEGGTRAPPRGERDGGARLDERAPHPGREPAPEGGDRRDQPWNRRTADLSRAGGG